MLPFALLIILHPFPFAQISSSAASRSSSPSALAAHSRRHHQHRSGMIIKHIISCSTKRKESSDRCFVSTSCRFPLSHRYNTLAPALSLSLSVVHSLIHYRRRTALFSFAAALCFESLFFAFFFAFRCFLLHLFHHALPLLLSNIHTSHITISTAPSLLLSPPAACCCCCCYHHH